jgi:GDPmannose 4,6-dehydratase
MIISAIFSIVEQVRPDEVYHLGAVSFVSYSFFDAAHTLNVNIYGTLHVLSAIKILGLKSKLFFAGSSEMFGNVKVSPQNESTPFFPRSPYGSSKLAGFELVRKYRVAYGIFACTGIMYNHESHRRGAEFVTKKIVSRAVKIKNGETNELVLGNIDVERDWGYALDYVEAMWKMLQQEKPVDYVLATGKLCDLSSVLDIVFQKLNLNWRDYVKYDASFHRASNKIPLVGDFSKARKELNWEPKKSIREVLIEMVEEEIKESQR